MNIAHGVVGLRSRKSPTQSRGTKTSRAGLDRLMALVRRGKVDIVVCFKLDRLGRSLSHLAALIGEFNAHNVALVVPAQGIDTSGANSAARCS